MKALVRYTSFLVVLTGLLITKWTFVENDLLTWVHLIIGIGYSVLFLLFSFDHLQTHKDRLKGKDPLPITGWLQLSSGAIALFTGFVLYLYGSLQLTPWSEVHLGSSIVFAGSLLTHVSKREKK